MKLDDSYKFRIWDKEKNAFLLESSHDEYGHIEYPASDLCIDSSGSLVLEHSCCGGCCAACIVLVTNKDRYIIQKCTGIKDKNGRLIYEGDILGYYKENANINNIILIRFNTRDVFFMDQNGCKIDFLFITMSLQIIGNILESKELLNEL